MFGRTRKEIVIHRLLQPDLWAAEVDVGQMEEAFMNLYVNAWHAMDGIFVPDGEDNTFVGNNVNDFDPWDVHVFLGENAVDNYYIGRGGVVSDPFEQNTVTGVDQVLYRPMTAEEANRVAEAMSGLNDWR